MRYEIHGTTLPTLDILLRVGESVYTESGGMAWLRGDIKMTTAAHGGILKGLARTLYGESMFMTTYTCESDHGLVTFTPSMPGAILPVELRSHESRVCQKQSFLVAQTSVDLSLHFRKRLGAGLFGGEGFILQELSGPGIAWVEIAGEVREFTLQVGETMRVDPGHLAMYEPSVNFSIDAISGAKNILFGGEGLFVTSLTGPGKIWLQSLPMSNLVSRLMRELPKNNG